MNHSEFMIGQTFWCSGRQWRCTDIGSHVIVAIRIDQVDVGSPDPAKRRTLDFAAAEADGWFNGPPYAVAEQVFDEHDMEGCSPQSDVSDIPNAAADDTAS